MTASKILCNTWTLIFALFLLWENITQKNYLIISEHVEVVKEKYISEKNTVFWTRRYLDYEFGLYYILLDLNWKSFGQQFIITLSRNFTGVGLVWNRNLDYFIRLFYQNQYPVGLYSNLSSLIIFETKVIFQY